MDQPGVWAAVLAALQEYWGLTGVTAVERLQTFPTRFVQRISSEQGCFAVKVDAEPGAAVEGSACVQLAVGAALPRHVPSIKRDRSGALAVVEQGQRITVAEDISGGRPASNIRTSSRLGALLADLHALPSVPRPYAIPVPAAADELARQANDYPFAATFRTLSDRVRRIADQPAATIHGELNLSNVVQRCDGDLVLVDWDQAGTGPIALDLGYPLICVFLHEDLSWHAEQAAAFYTGYIEHSTAQLPAAETIFDAAILHAMRYVGFANTTDRWARIEHALAHEADLAPTLPRAPR